MKIHSTELWFQWEYLTSSLTRDYFVCIMLLFFQVDLLTSELFTADVMSMVSCLNQGAHKLRKSWKIWKITKKVPCMEKSWNLKKKNNHGKIMEFCEII